MISTTDYYKIKNHNLFKEFTVEQFDGLAKHIKKRKIPRDQIVAFADDKREHLFFVDTGFLRIEQYNESDMFTCIDYVKPNSVFPCGGMFVDENYHHSVVAITDVELFYIPMAMYEALCLKNIQQMKKVCIAISNILRFYEMRLRNLVISSAKDRVIQALALLYVDVSDDKQQVPFPMTHLEISKLCGTTRETISHVFKELKEKGIIAYEHKRLRFIDVGYFKRYII